MSINEFNKIHKLKLETKDITVLIDIIKMSIQETKENKHNIKNTKMLKAFRENKERLLKSIERQIKA